jgi:6-pyruvoyltetrahydropterin/6-carboxytetrahydropterin synthase
MKCEICGTILKSITWSHLKKHKITLDEYRKKFNIQLLLDPEIGQGISKKNKGVINIGEKNAAKRKEIQEKIRNSVKQQWESGTYSERVNGMLGKFKELHHNWLPEKHTELYMTETNYKEFLSRFQDIDKCSRCGAEDRIINIHHIDEDHANFLPSNLEPLCVPCHATFHYTTRKQIFLRIGKMFSFAGAHWLPAYQGNCNRCHGHEWKLEVVIKKRIDPDTGMVLDFAELKKIVTKNVIDIFDHQLLNDILENPTAENICVWIWDKLMLEGHLKGIASISIWETDGSRAELTEKNMLEIMKSTISEYIGRNQK